MNEQKRGDDAADHAPKPRKQPDQPSKAKGDRQDGENYAERTDGGRAIKDENLSSANDE